MWLGIDDILTITRGLFLSLFASGSPCVKTEAGEDKIAPFGDYYRFGLLRGSDLLTK